VDNLIQRVNVGDSLTRTAWSRPGRTALVDGPRRWTYAELNRWVNRLANGLAGAGWSRGDALALASGNSAEFLAVYYACAKLGVVCVPLNLGWRSDEVGHVLRHSGARGLAVESALVEAMAPGLAQAPGVGEVLVLDGGPPADPPVAGRVWTALDDLTGAVGEVAGAAGEVAGRAGEVAGRAGGVTGRAGDREPEAYVEDRDPLSYLYTSGTTSFPKGVMGSHLGIYLESMSAALESGWRADDRFLALMPMFHTAQLNAFCTPAVLVGAEIHVRRGFDAAAVLELVERERVSQLFALPMMYRQLLDHPDCASRDLSSLRRCVYAMAPMPQPLVKECLERFGCDFALLFGQTEMSPITTLFRPEHQLSHPGAVGTPITGVQVGIMDPDGELLPAGQLGEIVYRGPSTMTGYLHDPDATTEAFRHGWFHSGDVGRFDDDGVLWFADRYKDVIKTGGENVASIEVERAIYAACPEVAEAVVIGLPHERWTEAITAVVVPHPGTTIDPSALLSDLKTHLDGYKVPKSVIVAAELPHTSTGKIRKSVLRAHHATHYT
jgi:acyl-CoA synthetase (AMP-forming)/AMP-acid ligase II